MADAPDQPSRFLIPPEPPGDGSASGWAVVPGILVAVSGILLFALEQRPVGYLALVLGILLALAIGRRLFRDLLVLGLGLSIMAAVPISTDIGLGHMLVMGLAMVLAIGLPYLLSRAVFRDRTIRFPVFRGQPWSLAERLYLPVVPVIGYLVLPFYLIRSGVYANWPAADSADEAARLFLGTNALGIWDELFFICIAFAVFRRHLPVWQANLLQAVLFTSFLYELGFRSWGPLVIFPFALVQGYIFQKTRSLGYVVCVHLLFDLVLYLVLIHAHDRAFLPIFLY